MSAKSTVGRKAATSIVKHSVHGTVSKAKREPARASRLLALGALAGAVVGFLAGRRSAPAPPPTPAYATTVASPAVTVPSPSPIPTPTAAPANGEAGPLPPPD